MSEKIIVLNIGWMKHYIGLDNDEITDGGSFIREFGYGGEIFNFLPFEGYMYGCFQPPGRESVPYINRIIRIERLGATASSAAVDGVLVGWAARKPYEGGTYIVGWYKNATVFRQWQKPPVGSGREYKGDQLGYYVKAKVDDFILLPPERRLLQVPRASAPENHGKGGIGQANLWFADNGKYNDFKFRQDFVQFIENYRT